MKIDARPVLTALTQPLGQKNAAQTSNQAFGTDFAQLLNQGQKTAPQPLQMDQNLLDQSFLPKFDLVGQLQTNQATKASSNTSPYTAADDIESLLNLLDNYSQALANPANTLKDLAPLADDLGLMAEQLGRTSQKLSVEDPLKSLSADTATVAMVEAMKFNRGDYV
jgi:hypothetical protein